ncbi:hypothetical protein EX30DRAFT_166395 [Ascodesmis nigricans]|uniref:Zn(2)-C6 fungal-type domain-containing protein n=1 Tax=Ascodesmis nigricans TaxID=341454 RepID=A0A4S2MR43_9PEZI|nr:hypothetical protein EX30DRAFT_166395 [Ascodesmis nigricans]
MTTVDYYRSPPQYNNPFSSSAPTTSSASTSSSTTTTSSTPFPTDDLQNCFWGPVIDTNLPASITFTSPTSSLNSHQLPLLSTSVSSTSAAIQTPTTPFSASASPVLSAIGSRKRRRRTTATEIDEHAAWVAAATSTPVDHASPPMSSTPPSPGARSSSSGGGGGGHGASSSFRNVSACNRCRLRKNRCDQRLPACSSCEKADVKCVGYDPLNKREVPRRFVPSLRYAKRWTSLT